MSIKKYLRIIAAVAAVLMVLSACGVDLSSSEEDSRTVMRAGGYNVPYEVYRYLVMNCKSDGITDSDELENEVKMSLKELYAVFEIALDYGIEFEDEYINALVDEAVSSAVDECGGKSKYKKALAENYMNASVHRLLLKRDFVREEIYSAMLKSGEISTDAETMTRIAKSDEFICIKQILVQGDSAVKVLDDTIITPAESHTDEEAKAIAENARERAVAGEDFDALVNEVGESLYMFSNTDGYYLCKGMWEAENENAAFSLEIGEISPVVESSAGFSVFKRCEKSDEYIEENLDAISKNYYGAVLALKLEEAAVFMDITVTEEIPADLIK